METANTYQQPTFCDNIGGQNNPKPEMSSNIDNNTHTGEQADTQSANASLENYENLLISQRQEWTEKVNALNEQMQTLPKLEELMNVVYMTRQNAVDYYYSLSTFILKQSNTYKKKANELFISYKTNGYNGMRFSTDSQIQKCIDVQLGDKKVIIDLAVNQENYIKDTITSIDNIIYGINQKVKVYAMLNGIKL